MPKIYSIIVDEHIHYKIENHRSIRYIEICCKEYTTKKNYRRFGGSSSQFIHSFVVNIFIGFVCVMTLVNRSIHFGYYKIKAQTNTRQDRPSSVLFDDDLKSEDS